MEDRKQFRKLPLSECSLCPDCYKQFGWAVTAPPGVELRLFETTQTYEPQTVEATRCTTAPNDLLDALVRTVSLMDLRVLAS